MSDKGQPMEEVEVREGTHRRRRAVCTNAVPGPLEKLCDLAFRSSGGSCHSLLRSEGERGKGLPEGELWTRRGKGRRRVRASDRVRVGGRKLPPMENATECWSI